MKTCVKCDTGKPEEAFSKDRAAKDGLRNRCRKCMSEIFKADYRSRPEVWKGRVKKWDAANPDKRKRIQRRVDLRILYGLSLEGYDQMLREQRGCCAICDQVMKRPYVDHCHRTGRIRALLCASCNTGIGGLKDSPQICYRAAAYLEKFSG